MQIQVQCTSCGAALAVPQSPVTCVYCCPSCGTHFQVDQSPKANQTTSANPSVSLQRKSTISVPRLNPGPIHPQLPTTSRPTLSTPHPTNLAGKSKGNIRFIVTISVVSLGIAIALLLILRSNPSEPDTSTQNLPKQKPLDHKRAIEEKAKEFAKASATIIDRDLSDAREQQRLLEEERERQRAALGEIYGDKYFDGDHDAGYQFVIEIERVLQMMPSSLDEAKQLLIERMKENPALKSFIAKAGELPFAAKSKEGPMSFLNQYKSFGTGFFISSNGWIVSNRHVVGDAQWIDIRTSDGATHRGKVVKTDETFDLALLKVEAKAPKWLRVSKGEIELGLGRPVFTVGFPNPLLQGIEPKYTDGKVSSAAGMGDDKNFYQVSVPVQPGNSGGALVDAETGWVVGVVTLRLDRSSDGRSAQNVSYAIKSAPLQRFFESFRSNRSGEFELDSPNVSGAGGHIELAKDSAVQILVPRDGDQPNDE